VVEGSGLRALMTVIDVEH